MLELLEKVVMTTIGVAAITQKKAEELVAEMKDWYKLSEEEGKHLVDRIQAMAKENREKVQEMAEVEVRKVVERLGLGQLHARRRRRADHEAGPKRGRGHARGEGGPAGGLRRATARRPGPGDAAAAARRRSCAPARAPARRAPR